MTGVGSTPRDLSQFIVDTRKRIVSLERRQGAQGFALPERLSPSGMEVTDWNDAVEAGFYWSDAGAANNPTGSIAVGTVLVQPESPNDRVWQEVYFPSTADSNRKKSWRRVNDAADGSGTWSAWTLIDDSIGYHYMQTVVFTSSGTFTKASYSNLRAVRVKLVGGGGGGAGAAAPGTGLNSYGTGGGGAGYAESFILAGALGSSETVTVGAGGAGGVGSADGSNGGASSFGSLVAADGGEGGFVKISSALGGYLPGGLGGQGTAGDILTQGQGGGDGAGAGTLASGGMGGSSQLGGGGRAEGTGGGSSGRGGDPGGVFGGGGGGASANAGSIARNGGAGGPGVVIVDLYG